MAKTPAKKVNPLKVASYIEDDGAYMTPKGRGMFIALARKFKRKGESEDKAKYAVEISFPPDADLSVLIEAANEVAKEAGLKGVDYGEGKLTAAVGGKKIKVREVFLKSDELYTAVTSKGEEVDLDGWITIRTNAKQRRPVVRDSAGDIIDLDDLETEAYSGRWMRIIVKPYAYDNEARGVAFGLESVQLLGNDDKYGSGAQNDGSSFSAVDDEDDDEEV